MRKAKSMKKNQNGDRNGCTRLCDLPDVVLQHILTKLPTKDAARTSTLSKKFEKLWTSIGTLRVSQDQFRQRSHFMNFVERTLLLHDQSSVNEFHLSCPIRSDASRINAWISKIIRHKVEVLKLCLDIILDLPYKLPYCLFNSQTLKSFHLDLSGILKLPSSINLPNLKTLTLSNVTFTDPDSTQQLLSSPLLEELTITDCVWKVGSIRVYAPMLASLSIDEYNVFSKPSLSEIVIICANLESFCYTGELLNEFIIRSSPSLAEAAIDFSGSKHDSVLASRVCKIIKGLSNVKDLTLSGDCLEALATKKKLLNDLPLFVRLTKLKLVGVTVNLDCKGFLKMLSKCPCLTILKFKEGIELLDDSVTNKRILDPVPPCFLSHLKKIIIYNFCPFEHELYAPAILLQTARVLEKLIIRCECSHNSLADWPKKREVFQQLRKLPRASEHCGVNFH